MKEQSTPEKVIKLTTFLEIFKFVKWDRFVETSVKSIYVYGWIKRPKDAYKDFIVVEWDLEKSKGGWFITSSVKYDNQIRDILRTNRLAYVPCKRVESISKAKNVIKI